MLSSTDGCKWDLVGPGFEEDRAISSINPSMSSSVGLEPVRSRWAWEDDTAGDLVCLRIGDVDRDRAAARILGTGVVYLVATPLPFEDSPNFDIGSNGSKASSDPYILSTVTGRLADRAVYKDTSLGANNNKR